MCRFSHADFNFASKSAPPRLAVSERTLKTCSSQTMSSSSIPARRPSALSRWCWLVLKFGRYGLADVLKYSFFRSETFEESINEGGSLLVRSPR